MTGRHYRSDCSSAFSINYMLSISIFPEEEGVASAWKSRCQRIEHNDENNDLIFFCLNVFLSAL